jgi:hypothetical protein
LITQTGATPAASASRATPQIGAIFAATLVVAVAITAVEELRGAP